MQPITVPGDRLPPDIQQILDEIDNADRAAELLVSSLSDAQFHWQPDEGRRWSIAQCLEHLAAINTLYGGAIRKAVDNARHRGWSRTGPLAPGPFGRWFIRSQEPPVKHRVRAPGRVRPAAKLSRDDVMRRYRESNEALRHLTRAAATIDANRATYPNPFLKLLRVKVATGLRVLPAHERRHLWQADQVRQRAEFPQA